MASSFNTITDKQIQMNTQKVHTHGSHISMDKVEHEKQSTASYHATRGFTCVSKQLF